MTDLNIEYLPVSELIPYESNARTHSDEQVDQIVASMSEFGFTNPVLIDSDLGVIAGHGRIMAANRMGLEKVPTIRLDHLTDEQKRAYILADNKLALNAGWDEDLLAIELSALDELGFDVALTGFSEDEVSTLVSLLDEPADGLTDEDAVPDIPDDPVTVLGDIWLMGDHRLMCGDSAATNNTDDLLNGFVPNAIVTDPPYGIGIDGQKESKSKNPKHNRKHHESKGWDSERPDSSVFSWIAALKIPSVIWGGNYFADLLPPTRGWLYWSKGQDGLTMSDGELAWTTEDRPLRSLTVNRAALKGSVHPTQKPVKVIDFSVDFLRVPVGGAVLDLFAGSGTTCIACEKKGMRSFLMEMDGGYCDSAISRWQDYTGKEAALESTGQTFAEVKAERG